MAVSVTTTCRDINELSPEAKQACMLFFLQCYLDKVDIFITETYRSQGRQDYLYEQGRTRPGSIVTWTRSSQHKSRLAWDIGAIQNEASDFNIYDTKTLKRAGIVANRMGITWGGNWVKNLDYPHFEVPKGWKPKPIHTSDATVIPATSSKGKTQVIPKGGQVKPTQPPTQKPPIKEEEQVKILTIADATNPTTKQRLRADLVQAQVDGLLTSDKHLKSFDDGTLNAVDVALLANYINSKPTIKNYSATFREFIKSVLKRAFSQGIINGTKWIEEAENETLKVNDAMMLITYISARGGNLVNIPMNKEFFKEVLLKGRKETELQGDELATFKKIESEDFTSLDAEVLLLNKMK